MLRRRGVLRATHSRHPDPIMDDGDLAELSHWLGHLVPDLTHAKDAAE